MSTCLDFFSHNPKLYNYYFKGRKKLHSCTSVKQSFDIYDLMLGTYVNIFFVID